ncbi:alpha/beta hydrolase, partial [Bifidobacterium adolescentis]
MVPFKDEDCERFMEQEVKPWIEENVTDFAFDSYDGKKLQAYCAIPEKPKKALVFVHGFCEFFGKYHELFYDFYHAGYAVFFYEQRGFGKSLREVSDKDAVYVRNFAEYVEDLKLFTDEVFKMTEKKLDLMLFAHSMGGCVGALYLEKYPETFKKAVLSSPMMRMALEPRLKKVARPLCLVQKALHHAKRVTIGQERFDERPDFKNSCALSEARYSYQFKQRLKNAEYQTNGATYAWVLAALNAEKQLMQ